MEQIIYTTLEYFLVYAFLGWCTEVTYQAVKKGIVVNRGFLNGPVCPIYGCGVLAVFAMLAAVGDGDPEKMNALVVFAFGIVLATLIELFGGWALDKLFHARWWDYTNEPLNFHGYICLRFSIIWGLGILLVVKVVNPAIMNLLGLLPRTLGWVVIAVFSACFLADVVVSVMVMVGLNKRMAEIDELQAKMRVVSNDLSQRIGTGTLETMVKVDQAKVQTALAKAEARDQIDQAKAEAKEQIDQAKAGVWEQVDQRMADVQEQMDQKWKERVAELQARDAQLKDLDVKRSQLIDRIRGSKHFGTGRLLRAFPDMQHREHGDLLERLRENL